MATAPTYTDQQILDSSAARYLFSFAESHGIYGGLYGPLLIQAHQKRILPWLRSNTHLLGQSMGPIVATYAAQNLQAAEDKAKKAYYDRTYPPTSTLTAAQLANGVVVARQKLVRSCAVFPRGGAASVETLSNSAGPDG